MSPTNIHGEEYRIGKIFSDDFVFRIPDYQRPYVWTIEQAGELLDDLLSFIGGDDQKVKEINPYFLGSIVLIKGDAPDAEVVDGQQRLITLTILYAALRELAPPEFGKGLTNRLYEEADPVEGTTNHYRLTLREDDAEFFKNYVQDKDGLKALEDQKAVLKQTSPHSQKNILDNALYFLERLRDIPEAQRERLAQSINLRCFLVVVSTPNIESAYRIFAVLNDRGLPLTYPDILKSEILGSIPEGTLRGEYAKKWVAEEEQLGREPFQNLFSHIRMVHRKTKVRNVLTEFREYIRPDQYPQSFIDDTLLPMANAFGDIRNASYESTTNSDEINELLRWLRQIDNADWIPPAILYMKLYRYQPERLLPFFRDLERLAAGLMILRTYVNRRIERYGRVLWAIEKEEDLCSETSPLQLTKEERQKVVEELSGNIYALGKVCTFTLLRVDSELSDGSATYKYPIISIEHVLPQNPPKGSEWLEWFPNEEERINSTHRLGNLVLLSRRTNRKAQNFDFEKKKQVYFRSQDGASPSILTSQVLDHEVWTPETIEWRQAKLVNTLKKVWRL